jgi:hypothetical protein
LIENKIPPTSGYTTQYQNVGSTQNRGIELQLGATVVRTKDFNWNANFNIAFNKNKIVSALVHKASSLPIPAGSVQQLTQMITC